MNINIVLQENKSTNNANVRELEQSERNDSEPRKTEAEFKPEFKKFILQQKAKQTCYKDTTDMNKLRKFFNTTGEERSTENIPPERLNQILCEFFMTTKRNNGSEFEPGTFSSFQNSFQRFCHIQAQM